MFKVKAYLVILLVSLSLLGIAQDYNSQADSLWSVFNDEEVADSTRLKSITKLNWEHYLFSNPDSSIIISEITLDFAEEKGQKEVKYSAYNLMGIAYSMKGDYKTSNFYYQKVLDFAIENENLGNLATITSNMSTNHYYMGDIDKAIEKSEEAYKYRLEIGDSSLIASSYINLGAFYYEQGNYHLALDFFLKGLDYFEGKNDQNNKVDIYNNLGNLYNNWDKKEKAINYFQECIEISDSINDIKTLSSCCNNLAKVYFSQERYDKAKEYFLKSHKHATEMKDKRAEANALANLSLILKNSENYDSSLLLLNQSTEININIGDKKRTLTNYVNYSNLYNELGNNQKEEDYAIKAYKIAMELKSLRFISQSSKRLWKVYDKLGNINEAYTYLLKYTESKDSLDQIQNKEELVRQELKYDYEKKMLTDSLENNKQKKIAAAKIEAQKVQLEKERFQRLSLFGGLFVLVAFLAVVLNRFRVTRKQRDIIEGQKQIVEHKNKEILDSITYAKRLQEAILPSEKIVKSYLLNSFILYKPKDIVAGDFYFMDVIEEGNKKLIYYVAADSTGHGVPGAMVSIVGANGLKRCLQEFGLRKPGEILDRLSKIVAGSFSHGKEKIRDGMDIALCCLEMENENIIRLHYAGANNPLWVINPNRTTIPEGALPFKEGGGFEIKANKQAIGYTENITSFQSHTIEIEKGDTVYTFSDGYADQFGGEHGKKMKSANFRKFLLELYDKPMNQQFDILNGHFEEWKGDREQLDDVCVIGVRL